MIESKNNTSVSVMPNSPSEIYVYSDKDYNENYNIIFNKIDDGLEIVLPDDFNEPLNENSFSDNVSSIVFGRFFNQTIIKNSLPENLKYLVFGDEYNKKLAPEVLPKKLQSLTFGKNYNIELIAQVLPSSLLYLKIGEKYNKEFVQNVLPNSLIVLEFDQFSRFNKGIKKGIRPQSLRKIIFGDEYNQELKPNRLPPNLKYLILGKNYDYLIEADVLPNTLKYIEFGFKYRSSLSNLPPSVEIVFFDRYDGIDWNLPPTVTKIIIKNYVPIKNAPLVQNNLIPYTVNQVQLINYKINNDFSMVIPINCMLVNKWGDKINI